MSSPAYPGVAYPGDTYPSLTSTGGVFSPPTVSRHLLPDRATNRPFNRMVTIVGLTVLKDSGGSYRTVETSTDEEIKNAAVAYIGGHTYQVDSTEMSALRAAGYTVNPL